jgi:hypothetical protein
MVSTTEKIQAMHCLWLGQEEWLKHGTNTFFKNFLRPSMNCLFCHFDGSVPEFSAAYPTFNHTTFADKCCTGKGNTCTRKHEKSLLNRTKILIFYITVENYFFILLFLRSFLASHPTLVDLYISIGGFPTSPLFGLSWGFTMTQIPGWVLDDVTAPTAPQPNDTLILEGFSFTPKLLRQKG